MEKLNPGKKEIVLGDAVDGDVVEKPEVQEEPIVEVPHPGVSTKPLEKENETA